MKRGPQSTSGSIRDDLRETLRLALPVMVSRTGVLMIVAVDIAMTGHAGSQELAYYGIASAPHVPLLLVGIGLLMGTVVLTAQAFGAGRFGECGRVWRVALVHAALCGLALLALCHAGEWFLLLSGQTPDLARGGGRVLVMFGWGLPAIFLYVTTTFFLEGMGRPLPGMVTIILANLVNAGLNWLFIYGNLGAPAMGAAGAALATSLTRWFMFSCIAGYALHRLDRQRFGITGPIAGHLAIGKRLRRIGYPMSLSHLLESSAFSAMTLFAGLAGALHVAAYSLAINLSSIVFMANLGLAVAAGVRVAQAVGRQDPAGARRAGWSAAALSAVLLVIAGAVFAMAPESLGRIYSADPAVLVLAAPCVVMVGLVLVPDGVQAVLMGALRSTGDVWPATLLYLFSFWLLMVPVGYHLGVGRDGGAVALLEAVLVGCVVAAVSLGARFAVVSRRRLDPA